MPIDNSSRFPKPLAADLQELSEGMAIVINGDTAPKAITSGQYLFIKNHSTLATGGYHATAAIASGADITSSNVAADANGIVNGAFSSLSEQFAWKQGNNTTGQANVSLPSVFNELLIECYIDSQVHVTIYIPAMLLNTTEKAFGSGAYALDNVTYGAEVKVTNTYAKLNWVYQNQTNKASSTVLVVYYR